ncbi:hypothetical protein PUW24_14280 [Paenibacillus urinalis]|uniref:Uncharacterized protein n=1 Tax=Paenibacillus urinalis TaxID=521520 RepID=A0AAX3N488_9BACL|nr:MULTISPECIES: hypothetical protein [Paenibacillus]WDH83934.1 hypothetical protein PUW23_06880 [Paenibacillus urinalis]WDH95392.1 hypothetical protein PUW24_14280 [Paenibacillus urinalis]WDI03588.1 hypothetical protein PUW25_06405 [Paenibacillus urinalis]GAK40946.1 hypothetical protein TCA2_3437 [Paenibacillus sp. TCA20]
MKNIMVQMTSKKAADLLDQWIVFLDMDNPKAWDHDEYPYIKESLGVVRSVVKLLRGKGAGKAPGKKELAELLNEFIEEIALDDEQEWEKENRAFVQEVHEAAKFAVRFLRG